MSKHIVESFTTKKYRDMVFKYINETSGIPLASDWCEATEDLYITCNKEMWCKYSRSAENVTHCIRDFIQGYQQGANLKWKDICTPIDWDKKFD